MSQYFSIFDTDINVFFKHAALPQFNNQTYTGSILVAVNPYKELGCYTTVSDNVLFMPTFASTLVMWYKVLMLLFRGLTTFLISSYNLKLAILVFIYTANSATALTIILVFR